LLFEAAPPATLLYFFLICGGGTLKSKVSLSSHP
jgi:hypothetical protein